MNIFLTDPCPTACAQALDDKRLGKMVLETAQLLSTVCHMLQIPADHLYKRTHWNHPCSLFARKSLPNFKWLTEHGLALGKEFEYRFGHVHASEDMLVLAYKTLLSGVENGVGLTPGWQEACNSLVFSFNCSGFDTGCVFNDYRLCMLRKWENDKPPAKWSRRKQPKWRSEE